MRILFQVGQEAEAGGASWLDFFVKEIGVPGARQTAQEWVITGIVMAVLVTGLMLALKWKLKDKAGTAREVWPLSRVFGFAFVGLFPAFLVMLAIYYFNLNFTMILGVGGLFKGVLFEWLLYLAAMFVGDMAIRRFRSDYGW
jgi:hypothetical protein